MGWPLYQSRRAARRRLVARFGIVLLAAIGSALIGWAIVVPATPEPPLLPDDEPVQTVTPSVAPSDTPSATPTPELRNPRGNPKKITVISQSKGTLIRAKMQDIYVRPDGRLVPPPGVAGWLADKGWPKPGVLSRYNSIVAGHVSGGGKPDVFYRLPDVRKGDRVVIEYDSGDRVIITITKNPVNVGKTTVTSAPKYDWVWETKDGTEQRLVSFFTCNPASEHINGHSVDNWVTQGEVVEVIRA